MITKYDLSILIPAYNEEDSLEELFHDIQTAFPRAGDCRTEIIFVDDGSTDSTLDKLKSIQHDDSRVIIISFRKNLGKTIALAEGFKSCRGQIIATLDADLQNDPADIKPMMAALNDQTDLVCGWRKRRNDPFEKTFPSKVINSVIWLFTRLRIHDINCGLKVMKREIVESMKLSGKQHRYIPLKAHYGGYGIDEFEVNHRPRKYGHSKFGFLRFPEGIFDLTTIIFMGKFERSPLYLFGGLGFFLFSLGGAILLYLSIGWFFGQWISSRPLFVLSIMFIILGFHVFSFGLLAEMVLSIAGNDDIIPKKIFIGESKPEEQDGDTTDH